MAATQPGVNTNTVHNYKDVIVEDDRIWVPGDASSPDSVITYTEETITPPDTTVTVKKLVKPGYMEVIPDRIETVKNVIDGYYQKVKVWVEDKYEMVKKVTPKQLITVKQKVEGYMKETKVWVA